MTNNQEEYYPTDDTQLAAYLVAEGFEILDVDYSDPKRAKFLFKNNGDNIQEKAYLFRTAKSSTEPMTYMRIYRRLCTIARQQLEWYKGIL